MDDTEKRWLLIALLAMAGRPCLLPAADVLDQIKAHNSPWLAPDRASFPRLSYTSRAKDKRQAVSSHEMPSLHERRGLRLTLGLDEYVARPRECDVRVRYEGKLDGRDVLVVQVTGPRFTLWRHHGLQGVQGDYGIGGVTWGDLVVDKSTWRPIVSRHGDYDFLFLNYAQVRPGQYAPLRIVAFGRRNGVWDFRFQWANGRVWLFDRSFDKDAKLVAEMEDLTLNGAPPARTERALDVPSVTSLTRFDFDRIIDRHNVCSEDRLVAAIIDRNRPWLAPSYDHLQSVEFVHDLSPKGTDERFAWRRDGTSLIEVVTGKSANTKGLSPKRWVTTPEPAHYYLAPGAKLAKCESSDRAFCSDHTRNRIIGTSARCVLFEWGRDPEGFAIRRIENTEDGRHHRVFLSPKRPCRVSTGTKFHSSRWAYLRDLEVHETEILVDAEKLVPLREWDYYRDGAKKCEVQFSDYIAVRGDRVVPRQIHFRFPSYRLDLQYTFQWRPEGLWLLKEGVCKLERRGADQRTEEVVDLRINRPVAGLEDALAVVDATRAYLDTREPREKRLVTVHPFVLGRKVELDAPPNGGNAVFTLGNEGNLVAEVTFGSGRQTRNLSIGLLDEKMHLVAAAQSCIGDATQTAILSFGTMRALAEAKYMWCSRGGGAGTEGVETRAISVYPFAPGNEISVHAADRRTGKTQVKRIRFDPDEAGRLSCRAELVSEERWMDYETIIAVALLDTRGQLAAAAQTCCVVKVRKDIATAQADLTLGPWADLRNTNSFLLGVARGDILGRLAGSLWRKVTRRHNSPTFSLDQLLAADDVRVLRAGIHMLRAKRFHGELVSDDWNPSRSPQRMQERLKQLRPHVPRLAELLARTDAPEVLASVCCLLGHTRDRQLIARLAPLLSHDHDTVKDGAAVGLGMMGDDRGIPRLDAILARPFPDDREARRAAGRWADDAILALHGIGSDEAVDVLGRRLLSAVEDITATPGRGGGTHISGSGLGLAHRLVPMLSHMESPAATEFLVETYRSVDPRVVSSLELLHALVLHQERTRDFFRESISTGDATALRVLYRTEDPTYVPQVRELTFRDDIDENVFSACVRYLSSLEDCTDALALLRDIHNADVHRAATHARLRVCGALAANGDYRGFEYAFAVLTGLEEPYQQPTDRRKRSRLRSRRRSISRAALYALTEKVATDALADLVEPKLNAQSKPTVLAALTVIGKLKQTPDALLPTVRRLRQHPEAAIAERAAKLLRRQQ